MSEGSNLLIFCGSRSPWLRLRAWLALGVLGIIPADVPVRVATGAVEAPIIRGRTSMRIILSSRNELRVLVISGNSTLSSLAVEGSIINVRTSLVEDSRGAVGV